jgi:uncharacterized short protein YbdD (DUF466 family)
MPKDKAKPKGTMSAYACFVQVIREEHKKKHPEEQIVFSEFSKKCAEKWKTMVPKEKKRFEDMAAADKQRHDREMETYNASHAEVGGRKRKRQKDPNQPKRALSAFLYFCEDKRAGVRSAHPDYKMGDISKELSHLWEACTDKTKYEARSNTDKQRYEQQMTEYKKTAPAKKK